MVNSLKNLDALKTLQKQLVTDDLDAKLKNKPIIRFEEFISHMESKNIKFNIMDEEKAISILQDMNYYYKLSCYKRNFRKVKGKYVDLEFSYLVDLASVDMQLRYLFIEASLDIEHALKTHIMTDITKNNNIDGYKIIQSFVHSTTETDNPVSIEKLMKNASKSLHYQNDMYEKNKYNPSVWVLLEVMGFGDFLNFFTFYYERNPSVNFQISSIKGALYGVKKIRNAASHNNPFLLNLAYLQLSNINSYVEGYAKSLGIGEQIYKCSKVHDMLSLFFIHETFVKGNGSKKYRSDAFVNLIEKNKKRFSYLPIGNDVKIYFKIMDKVVDNYVSKLV